MNEVIIAKLWLVTQLKLDSVLTGAITNNGKRTRIYDTQAQQDAPFPYVILALQDNGEDLYELGAYRVMTTFNFLVRVVGLSSTYLEQLAELAGRIDTQLHRTEADSFESRVYHSGNHIGHVIASTRLSPYEAPSVEHGVDYREIGGIYRILAKKVA